MERFDYHVHTCYSHDGAYSAVEQLEAAAKIGISELCFTDHVDFDVRDESVPYLPADLNALRCDLNEIGTEYKGVRIKLGAEISLADKTAAELSKEYVMTANPDFIIGSVHTVNTVDTYFPEYFVGKTKQTAYYAYLDTIFHSIKDCDIMSVLGHYDFVAKYAPFQNRRMTLNVSLELFTEIFKSLIANGKGIEINTSAWRDEPAWGSDILKLYHELGGEYVTTGSDAHNPDRLGRRLDEAVLLAKQSDIPYIATFDKLKPKFHSIRD